MLARASVKRAGADLRPPAHRELFWTRACAWDGQGGRHHTTPHAKSHTHRARRSPQPPPRPTLGLGDQHLGRTEPVLPGGVGARADGRLKLPPPGAVVRRAHRLEVQLAVHVQMGYSKPGRNAGCAVLTTALMAGCDLQYFAARSSANRPKKQDSSQPSSCASPSRPVRDKTAQAEASP